jgi:hypothetical protein
LNPGLNSEKLSSNGLSYATAWFELYGSKIKGLCEQPGITGRVKDSKFLVTFLENY